MPWFVEKKVYFENQSLWELKILLLRLLRPQLMVAVAVRLMASYIEAFLFLEQQQQLQRWQRRQYQHWSLRTIYSFLLLFVLVRVVSFSHYYYSAVITFSSVLLER